MQNNDEIKPTLQDAIEVIKIRLEHAKNYVGIYSVMTNEKAKAFGEECKRDAAALQLALDILEGKREDDK